MKNYWSEEVKDYKTDQKIVQSLLLFFFFGAYML